MNWKKAFKRMNELADLQFVKNDQSKQFWKYGQENSIRWIVDQLNQNNRKGVLIADEPGMGKTRVVMSAILAVLENGGSVAAVVPPGLLYQWKKEWEDFISNLDLGENYSPIFLRSYYTLFENADFNFPLSDNSGKWLLISHNFGPPPLATNSRSFRYLLPVLVKALQSEARGEHKRNSYWQLVKRYYGDDDCIGADCTNCEGCDDPRFAQMNKAAHYLRKKNRWRLFNTIPERGLESEESKEEFKKWFNSEKGKEMLGELLGSVDLVVMDEAHKSRGESSRLNNLLEIIKKSQVVKYIAMTATPMELNHEQWNDLFNRISETYPEKAINNFVNAHFKANKMPDNRDIIRELIETSTSFANALKPYVSRRIRFKQDEMKKILELEKKDVENCAHPHHKWDPIKMSFAEVEEDWKPAIYSLEAIGKAAKGINRENDELKTLLTRLKIADSRYAAGQIYMADNENELDKTIQKFIEEHSEAKYWVMCGKLRRIQYWRKFQKNIGIKLHGHPRVQRVADEIEKNIWDKNGKLSQEKILVFGTFKKPMRALWDVLNLRAVLRFLDRKKPGEKKEPPIPAAKVCLKNKDIIWAEYERISTKKDLHFNRKFNTVDDLKKAIEKGRKSYSDSIRKRLSAHIDKKFVKTLPGYSVTINLESDIANYLRTRLINILICRGDSNESLKPKHIKNMALKIWIEYLESYLDIEEEGSEKIEKKTEWEKPDCFYCSEEQTGKIKKLHSFAESIGKDKIEELIKKEEEDISGHLGFFARMLDGDVKMETRRILQAQFNSKDSFPRVLIAQSQVGREGLNLHKACRRIIQFHSEWNPGVIEQQIGRVDRIESYWEELVLEYKANCNNVKAENFPKIIISPVIFEGTYDDYQYKVSKQRRETLNAHLYGEVLNEESLSKMPTEGDWVTIRNELMKSAPDFSPPNKN